MSHLAVAPAEAISFISFLVAWHGGVVPVYIDGAPRARSHIAAESVGELGDLLARRTALWDLRDSSQVEIGLPEAQPRVGGPAQCTVLWCWLESRDSVWRAWKRFQPDPTLVLRMGSSCRRLALWALNEPVPYVSLEPANKRIAYALHAPQKYALPEKLRIPLPGTFLRVGRKRPAPVLVTKMEIDNTYARSQVVATLKDPAPPYMTRLREGKVAKR